jgi:hypothetical protein
MYSEVSSRTRKNVEMLLKMIRGQLAKVDSSNRRQLLSSILEDKMYQQESATE